MAPRTLAALVASAIALPASLHASAAPCTAGQVDTTFGPASSNGYVQVAPWNAIWANNFEALTVGGDNKVYVGSAAAVDATSGFPYEGVSRSSKGGAIDRTYGGMGTVIPGGQIAPAPSVGPAGGLTIDASGNLVAVNETAAGYSVSRFLPDGTPDVSFGTNGVTQVPLVNPFWFVSILTLADGSTVIGTSATNPPAPNAYQAVFIKLTPSGAMDSTFGSGGVLYLVTPGLASGGQVRMTDIGLLSTGDIVGVGRFMNPSDGAFFQGFSVKIHANGSLDSTYGTGGFSIVSLGPTNLLPRKMAVQADDQVVAGGGAYASNDGPESIFTPTVLRFRTNGSLDPAFGTGGMSQFLAGPNNFVGNITLQANNKIVVDVNGTSASLIVRLTTAGQLDPAFGSGGSMSIPLTAPLGSGAFGVLDVRASGGKIFASLVSALNPSDSSPWSVFITAIDQGSGAGCR